MALTRSQALALIGCVPLLARCGRSAIGVGSKNFSENVILAEIYASALENAGIPVDRRMIVGDSQATLSAIRRGVIQIYPEYLGTGLVQIPGTRPPYPKKPGRILDKLRSTYEPWNLTWLNAAHASNSQGLAMTQATASKFGVHTISQCARAARRLRLVAPDDFFRRKDGLPGLEKFYNGKFQFKTQRSLEIGQQYDALANGEADVAVVFTSDPELRRDRILVLDDDRGFWPPYNVAPVVRIDALRAQPGIIKALNAASAKLTPTALFRLNALVGFCKIDPALLARGFLSGGWLREFDCPELQRARVG